MNDLMGNLDMYSLIIIMNLGRPPLPLRLERREETEGLVRRPRPLRRRRRPRPRLCGPPSGMHTEADSRLRELA